MRTCPLREPTSSPPPRHRIRCVVHLQLLVRDVGRRYETVSAETHPSVIRSECSGGNAPLIGAAAASEAAVEAAPPRGLGYEGCRAHIVGRVSAPWPPCQIQCWSKGGQDSLPLPHARQQRGHVRRVAQQVGLHDRRRRHRRVCGGHAQVPKRLGVCQEGGKEEPGPRRGAQRRERRRHIAPAAGRSPRQSYRCGRGEEPPAAGTPLRKGGGDDQGGGVVNGRQGHTRVPANENAQRARACTLSPTGRSTRGGMPALRSAAGGPMPEACSKGAVPKGPAATRTLWRADSVRGAHVAVVPASPDGTYPTPDTAVGRLPPGAAGG